MNFEKLEPSIGIKDLNSHLEDKNFIARSSSTTKVVNIFQSMGEIPSAETLLFNRSIYFIESRSSEQEQSNLASNPGIPPASSATDCDDLDLFMSKSKIGTESRKINDESLNPHNKQKLNKLHLTGRSRIKLDVKLVNDKTNIKEIKVKIRSIQMEGSLWGDIKLIVVRNVIIKFEIMAILEGDKVPVDLLIQKIQDFKDCVKSVNVIYIAKELIDTAIPTSNANQGIVVNRRPLLKKTPEPLTDEQGNFSTSSSFSNFNSGQVEEFSTAADSVLEENGLRKPLQGTSANLKYSNQSRERCKKILNDYQRSLDNLNFRLINLFGEKKVDYLTYIVGRNGLRYLQNKFKKRNFTEDYILTRKNGIMHFEFFSAGTAECNEFIIGESFVRIYDKIQLWSAFRKKIILIDEMKLEEKNVILYIFTSEVFEKNKMEVYRLVKKHGIKLKIVTNAQSSK